MNPSIKENSAILSIRFQSSLAPEKLMEICQEDLSLFRAVEGLSQKYYITDPEDGAISGFYTFDSIEARESFWNSELAQSIVGRYGVVVESLRVERYGLVISLN